MSDFPDSTDVDPFTLGYRGIVDALAASALFTGLVRLNNRRNETDPRMAFGQPQRGAISNLPEVELYQATYGIDPQAVNSTTVGWDQDYPLRVTGDIGGPVIVNKLKWAIFCALSHAGDDLGLRFVRGWKVVAARDQTPVPGGQHTEPARQYESVLVIRLACYWPKKLLPT